MAEQTFAAGDKVEWGSRDLRYVIDAGPFKGHRGPYFIVHAEGAERQYTANAADLTVLPAFEIGARVVHDGEPCTVTAGPFVDKYDPARSWYVVENADGSHETSSVNYLTAAPADEPIKADDRVRVLEDHPSGSQLSAGDVVTVTAVYHAGTAHEYYGTARADGGWYVKASEVERADDSNTFTHDGVTYDLDAEYCDGDGDHWQFSADTLHSDGTPLMGMNGMTAWSHSSLQYVLTSYGPLRKV
ncbi:phiSA1p31-related protein [Kitasatospora sp. NPDC050543]|uniref:phiSA1p31-related protein n=1 Tax=Kitasatospora sp. NPDC050543 TaxID=3364054 RepID=UPI0037895A02